MIKSSRDESVSFHVTQEVKMALKEESLKQKRSVSQLVFFASVQYLKILGHDVTEEVASNDVSR